jgi:hypothetical protein
MKIKCYNCLEEINIKERYVNLKTIENNKEIENLYFHLNCWKQYFNKKVTEKSIKEFENMDNWWCCECEICLTREDLQND